MSIVEVRMGATLRKEDPIIDRQCVKDPPRLQGKTLLILGVGVGSGHMRAAQAVEEAMRLQAPGMEVQVLDILDFGSLPYRRLYRSLYLLLARHLPRSLDFLYRLTDSLPFGLSRILPAIDRLAFRRLTRLILSDPPDLILCTHFLPLEILAPLRRFRSLPSPLFGVVTDLHPHGIWLWSGVDRYFTADEEGARTIARRLPKTATSPVGIPISPSFSRKFDRQCLRKNLGLPDRWTILLLAGGEGVGDLPALIDSFRGFPESITLVAIAGKNPRLEARCHRLAKTFTSPEHLVRVRGFVPNMADWMGASDVVVTKPGGLTLVEALGLGRPLVLLPARGGQEEINRKWALALGAAAGCEVPEGAGPLLAALFSQPGRLEAMARAARNAGRPLTAKVVAREIIRTLCDPPETLGRTP
ncbi:MAG: MGDG synthase family glycosyltransferase [Leptospirillia bacterium]